LFGKMRGRNNVDVLQEVLVQPVGIGKLGACGARIYTQEELDRLCGLQERSERKTTSGDMCNGVVNADKVSRGSKVMSLQKGASNSHVSCP
jgi:hypothetical protein